MPLNHRVCSLSLLFSVVIAITVACTENQEPDASTNTSLDWRDSSSTKNVEVRGSALRLDNAGSDPRKGTWTSSPIKLKSKRSLSALEIRFNLLESIDFTRISRDSTLFSKHYHDPILFHFPDRRFPYHLIVGTQKNGESAYFKTQQFSMQRRSWRQVEDSYRIAGSYEYDDIEYVDGRFLAYENGNIHRANSLKGEWKKVGNFPMTDIGVFWNTETQRCHIYGEAGPQIHGWSGSAVGHYVSNSCAGNWQHEGKVIGYEETSNGFGDFEPFIVNNTPLLFYDNSTGHHPDYRIGLLTNQTFGGNWRFVRNVVKPRRRGTDFGDEYGVQDPSVVYSDSRQALFMVTNGHRDSSGPPNGGLQAYQYRFPTIELSAAVDVDGDKNFDTEISREVQANVSSTFRHGGKSISVEPSTVSLSSLPAGEHLQITLKLSSIRSPGPMNSATPIIDSAEITYR